MHYRYFKYRYVPALTGKYRCTYRTVPVEVDVDVDVDVAEAPGGEADASGGDEAGSPRRPALALVRLRDRARKMRPRIQYVVEKLHPLN